jgi:hypothetical protein
VKGAYLYILIVLYYFTFFRGVVQVPQDSVERLLQENDDQVFISMCYRYVFFTISHPSFLIIGQTTVVSPTTAGSIVPTTIQDRGSIVWYTY